MNIKATDAEVSQRKTFGFLHMFFHTGLLMEHIEDMGPYILTVWNASEMRETEVALWAALWRCIYYTGG
jgi:hypothetical protein